MVFTSNPARMAWTDEEDQRLKDAVARFGVKRWAQIATMLPGRTSKACSHRWRTYLQPGVMHTSTNPFTDWEVAVVKSHRKDAAGPHQRRHQELLVCPQAKEPALPRVSNSIPDARIWLARPVACRQQYQQAYSSARKDGVARVRTSVACEEQGVRQPGLWQ
ncbi:Myb-like DNA-binding domain-containing protein [Scenedesmus sp. NREL 46B-D3]|nr:Myb-like DNA-binding domain-containing protein [Scenedesmus sp. NREL 46B-D3]